MKIKWIQLLKWYLILSFIGLFLSIIANYGNKKQESINTTNEVIQKKDIDVSNKINTISKNKKLSDSLKKDIYMQLYQANWYIINVMDKPSDVDEIIKLFANEKKIAKEKLSVKFNISVEELEKIDSEYSGKYSGDAYQKMKEMEQKIKIPKNY